MEVAKKIMPVAVIRLTPVSVVPKADLTQVKRVVLQGFIYRITQNRPMRHPPI